MQGGQEEGPAPAVRGPSAPDLRSALQGGDLVREDRAQQGQQGSAREEGTAWPAVVGTSWGRHGNVGRLATAAVEVTTDLASEKHLACHLLPVGRGLGVASLPPGNCAECPQG